MDMLTFSGMHFSVAPGVIHMVSNIKLTAEAETEDQTSGGTKYISRKNGKPTQITVNVGLFKQAGVDVQSVLNGCMQKARDGAVDYVLIGGKRLFECKFMLVKAEASSIELLPNGTMKSAQIALTFKQSTLNDGGMPPAAPTGGGGGSTAPATTTKPPASGTTFKKITGEAKAKLDKQAASIKAAITVATKKAAAAGKVTKIVSTKIRGH